MNRRESLKTLAVGTLAAGLVLEACKEKTAAQGPIATEDFNFDRQPEEIERYKEIISKTFFTEHEMETITILGDIIIPKDEISGSASEAKVPEFIEFIVKDMPEHQLPLRGGLRWLDMQCLKRFEASFKDSSTSQKIEMIDSIAYPEKAKPDMAPGVNFFNLMRNLTATGFYTSEMGVKDMGYMGNVPTKWNGVPDDVLKQYNLAYTEKELNETV
ncbi:MAG: gluconate 2-dehydrogenase subunit 3 family protein [Bacteroidota bacterium]|nr:gluconate 2-dehydrogenase subunit 3 family protein [Bacteroidota bacterium]